MTSNHNKAQRRHHEYRVKANRAKQMAKPATPREVGMFATTPKACSCPLCGNPRKYFREKPIQERRFLAVSELYLLGE